MTVARSGPSCLPTSAAMAPQWKGIIGGPVLTGHRTINEERSTHLPIMTPGRKPPPSEHLSGGPLAGDLLFASNLGSVANSSDTLRLDRKTDVLSRMINAFYDPVEQDEMLSPFFPGGGAPTIVAM